ncbi:MAG: helix-turn-helix domain-containing protein [Bacilli bacterium]|nr:helix-turn-helix domain-containing protein [Bacilli bacterium]
MILETTKSKTVLKFIIDNQPMYNNEKYYYFWIINIEEETDITKAISFFEEIFIDAIFIKYEGIYLMFYFQDVEFEMENIIASLIDDLSFKINIYASSKVDAKDNESFHTIYKLYNQYLNHKSKFYSTNLDLVSEIVRINISNIKKIKPIILNKILEDPQMEVLIQAMFNNNLNVTKTASSVYMHRNTVIKKLEYIKKETGLNIQRFIDANIMYWLLKIK